MTGPHHLAADAFGDPFELDRLPLPRKAAGYAVQRLDTDLLLDSATGDFLPVRSPKLQPAFARFEDAHAAGAQWVVQHHPDGSDHRLAIVPIGYDPLLERYVLIYGVLYGQPEISPENNGEQNASPENPPPRRRRPQRP
jgi:hypothetical protein